MGEGRVTIVGEEAKASDGTCLGTTEKAEITAAVGTDGLVLETEIDANCLVKVAYFGPPRFEDSLEPDNDSEKENESNQNIVGGIISGSLGPPELASSWSGNYLHSRHRLHDIAEIIIGDFWLHNDRRWNGSTVFVCSPGWTCFVAGQSKTYKSWNHPGSIQVSYNSHCTSTTSCSSVTANGTGNFTTDFFLCDPGDKIALNSTNIAYPNGTYSATYSRTSECNLAGMHAHYAVWSNLTKYDQTP